MRIISKLITRHANKSYDKILKEKLERIKGERVFWSERSECYLRTTELAGFKYLSFVIVCPYEIKTISGVTFEFQSKDKIYELKSESEIVESDYSEISKFGITRFDCDYDEGLLSFLLENSISEIQLNARNGQIMKTDVSVRFDSIDPEGLMRMLESNLS